MPHDPSHGCLSVIVPFFNERATLQRSLEAVAARPETGEVLAIDDGSTDGSTEIAESLAHPKIRVLRQLRNQGKGAAVRRGITEAQCRFVVIQDADLEYDPGEFPKLLEPLLAGKADAVYGSRFDKGRPIGMLASFYWGNRFLTFASNRRAPLGLSDMQTCYKMARREILQSLSLRENGFAIEPEITVELWRAGARVVEIPVSYKPRTHAEGKKVRWRDGLEALRVIATR